MNDLQTNRFLGDAAFGGALCLLVFLERLQFQLRQTEASAWWVSNGRDVVNAFALATLWLSLSLIGFSGAVSFTIASLIILIVTLFQSAIGEHRYALALTTTATFLLGAVVLAIPRQVNQLVALLLSQLF